MVHTSPARRTSCRRWSVRWPNCSHAVGRGECARRLEASPREGRSLPYQPDVLYPPVDVLVIAARVCNRHQHAPNLTIQYNHNHNHNHNHNSLKINDTIQLHLRVHVSNRQPTPSPAFHVSRVHRGRRGGGRCRGHAQRPAACVRGSRRPTTESVAACIFKKKFLLF